jgi:hypothetical protein
MLLDWFLKVAVVLVVATAHNVASWTGVDNAHLERRTESAMSEQQQTSGGFSGGFIDERDEREVARWSREFCHGLNIDVMAKRYGVEATADAIARHIAEKFPASTRGIALRECRAALQDTG